MISLHCYSYFLLLLAHLVDRNLQALDLWVLVLRSLLEDPILPEVLPLVEVLDPMEAYHLVHQVRGVPSYQVAASVDPSLDPSRVEGLVAQNLWVHQEAQRVVQIHLLGDQILQVVHVVVQILLVVRSLPLVA